MFPSLSILDTLDKIGKDAYNNSTMLEAVSRIPDNLFDKSLPPPPAPIIPVHHDIHKKQKKKLTSALARTGSLDSITSKPVVTRTVVGVRKSVAGKMASKVVAGGRTTSARAGLLFPAGRIKRHLRDVMVGQRVGAASGVYCAAVL
jgi:hypothetical protein